jgi:Kef-type K+ transport system membrane component KefB
MEIFYALLILLVATRVLGEVAVRLGQPALLGELIAGVLLGVWIHSSAETLPVLAGITEDPVFAAVTDMAVFFLMLMAGVEMHPRGLAQSSRTAVLVAIAGMVIPFALGFGLALLFLPESPYLLAQCLFVATALSVTAVPVSVRVLRDLGKLDSLPGQTIVAAAIIDDALSLLLLAVLTAIVTTGGAPSAHELLVLAGKIVLFFAITAALGLWVLPRVAPAVRRLMGEEIEFSALLAIGLAFAALAELLEMHLIIGAFIAGLFFSGRAVTPKVYEDVKSKLTGLTLGFFAPVFFASIGLHLEIDAITASPLFLVLFVVTAFAGKLIGAGGFARLQGFSSSDSLIVGVGMSARATVELVIANVALQAGLFSKPSPTPGVVSSLFSTVVIMAITTTTLTPIILRWLVNRQHATGSSHHGRGP